MNTAGGQSPGQRFRNADCIDRVLMDDKEFKQAKGSSQINWWATGRSRRRSRQHQKLERRPFHRARPVELAAPATT